MYTNSKPILSVFVSGYLASTFASWVLIFDSCLYSIYYYGRLWHCIVFCYCHWLSVIEYPCKLLLL